MSIAKRKFFLFTIVPILGTFLFSSFLTTPSFAADPTPAAKPEERKPFNCSCNYTLKGLGPSGEYCQRSMKRVMVNVGFTVSSDVAEILFEDNFGIKAMNERCYPAPDNTNMAREARRNKPIGPAITVEMLSKESCSKISGSGSFVVFSGQGHAGLYGVILEACTAEDLVQEKNQNDNGTPITAFAGQISALNKLKATSIQGVIGLGIKTATGIMGTVALIMLIYGGLLWMTAGGNSSQVEKAHDVIIWAALGIFLIFGSYAIVTFIFESVNPNQSP